MNSFKTIYNQNTLLSMLSYKRPHNSHSEINFINKFIKPVCNYEDDYGNLFVFIDGLVQTTNNPENLPTILFTAHTDTVHKFGGKQKIKLHFEPVKDAIHLFASVKNDVLGADCASGCFILLTMIEHFKKHPPLHHQVYAFFRNEENGGLGSYDSIKYSNETMKTVLKNIDKVISFDRMNYSDMVNVQSGGICCSDEFITANKFDTHFGYSSARGSFTDSANFADEFSNSGFKECTNLSIGYFDQHTKNEKQDLTFLIDILLPKLLTFNWDNLQVFRKYDQIEFPDYLGNYYSGNYELNPFNRTDEQQLKNLVKSDPDKIYNFLNEFCLIDEFIIKHGADFLESNDFSVDDINNFYGDV
jgi:hypothetical protein